MFLEQIRVEGWLGRKGGWQGRLENLGSLEAEPDSDLNLLCDLEQGS